MRNAFHMKVVFLAALAAAVGSTAVAANNRPGAPERIADIPLVLEPEGFVKAKASIPADALIVRRADEGVGAVALPAAQSIARLDYTFVTGEAVGDTPSDNLFRPAISANGQFLAYTSFAQNLVAEDTLGIAQVYRTDISTPAGTNLLVSKTAGGTGGNGGSGAPTFIYADNMTFEFWMNSISSDGTKICFTSEADNLQTAVTDTNNGSDVFLWNFNGGSPTIAMISTDSTGAQMANSPVNAPLNYSRDGVISGDGNFVAFLSTGTLPGTTARAFGTTADQESISLDLFRKNLSTNATELISAQAGVPTNEANGDSYDPSISNDGSVIAYTSVGSNNTAPSTPGGTTTFGPRTEIYVWNSGTTTCASRSASGSNVANEAFTAQLSPNGRFVAFNSRKAPGTAGTTMGTGTITSIAAGRHAYVRDLSGGDSAIRYVNTQNGVFLDPGLTRLMAPVPNNNGDVFFWGYGDMLVPVASRPNNHGSVWVKKFTNAWPATDFNGTVTCVSKSETGTEPNAGYGHFGNGFTGGRPDMITVSADGTKMVFTSTSHFGKGGGSLRNAWVATLDSNYNVTNLARYPKAISTPGVTVNFSGPTGMRLRDSKRVAISPNGRYAGLVVCSTGVLDKDTPPGLNVQRRYNSAAEGEAYRVDLNNKTIGYASFENIGGTITPIEVQGTASSLTATGANLSPGQGSAHIFPSGSPFNCSGVAVSNFGDVAFISQHSLEAGGVVVTGGQYVYVTNPTTAESELLTTYDGSFFADPPGATYYYTGVETYLSSDGRYVGFTHDTTNIHPEAVGDAMAYIYDRANPGASRIRMVSRKSNLGGGFVAQDVPIGPCVLVAMSNDGQKAVFQATEADDVLLGGPPSTGHLFLYNDMADGIPNNGDAGGATVSLISCNSTGALAASATVDGLPFSTGFGSTSGFDINASTFYFPAVIDSTIPDSPGGLSAGVTGSQLYAKSLTGPLNASTAGIQSALSCLTRKTDSTFLTAMTIVGGTTIGNPENFEEVDSATVSADGSTVVVVTNARSNATVGLPGSLGQDSNSPVNPTGGVSNYDVFVLENALSSPTWTVASRSVSGTQMTFGPEDFLQRQTPAAHNPGIGVTSTGRIRIVFGTEGDDFVGNGDSVFGRCIYVREYFTASPSAVEGPWSSYE